jgi:hypothetical protein
MSGREFLIISVTTDTKYDLELLRETLIVARNNISAYPITKKLIHNFAFIPTIPYRKIRNIFFWLASDRFAPSRAILVSFESCLKQLNVEDWSKSKKNELRAKLTANREDANWGVLTEVQVAACLTERFGNARVKYAPTLPTGKRCDASALINRRAVFFEVTAVNVGQVEGVLQDTFDGAGSTIYQEMSANAHLRLEVDTSRLIKTNGDFDVQKCKEQLVTSYKDLAIESFLTVNGNIVVDMSDLQGLWEKDKKLADQIDNLRRLDPELAQRIEQGELSVFSHLTPRAFDNTPFTAIWKMNTRRSFKAIEIAGQGLYPSAASSAEQTSFFKRLSRAIETKIAGGQLRKGGPNILALRASNWTVSGYERTGLFESDIAEIEFDTIHPILEKCLDKFKPTNLSAIMLFENQFSNARFIFNKYAQKASALTSGEVNLLIGPQAVSLSPFMEFATETLDQAKIDRCLKAVVETYNGQSKSREICDIKSFEQENDRYLRFVQIPIKTRVSKSWFIDPAIGVDHIFAEFGSAIAEGELRYTLQQIQQSAEERRVSGFTAEAIGQAITDFHNEKGTCSAILLPLGLYVTAHSWMRENGTPVVRYENGRVKMTIDLHASAALEIPTYFFRKETEIRGLIIYNRGHGTIVYKKPNATEFLSAQLYPSLEDNTSLEFLAKSVLSYQVKNKALAVTLTS